jgi:hypothetical protein
VPTVDHDINPTVKSVPGGPPVFVFPGKSRDSAALVRRRSLVFAPTGAKTVAIGTPSTYAQFGFCPISIGHLCEEALPDSIEEPEQKHRASTGLKQIATEAGKEVKVQPESGGSASRNELT